MGNMDKADHSGLEKRIGRLHLNQRLGIESDRDARVFGQGLNFFHIENWYSIHTVIRICLLLAGMHGRGKRNARNIEIRHNTIVLPQLPESFEGYTICQITDLHLDMNDDIPHVIAEHVRDLDYDLCVLTGDYRAKTFGPIQGALDGMKRVAPHLKQPIYGILGNHDSIRMVPQLEKLGVQMLLNESVAIERQGCHLYLAGIDDPHYYRADNLEKASRNVPDDAVSILLSHSPEMYRHAAHAGFDVMLCGHTHGGQVCLPGRFPLMCNVKAPRTFCQGAWKFHDLNGYTSAGAGVSIVDVRINCPPEITLHHLVRG